MTKQTSLARLNVFWQTVLSHTRRSGIMFAHEQLVNKQELAH